MIFDLIVSDGLICSVIYNLKMAMRSYLILIEWLIDLVICSFKMTFDEIVADSQSKFDRFGNL